jgi:hypothetical protein
MDKEAFDRALQMPCPIALVRAFVQEKLPGFLCDSKEKRPSYGIANTRLHLSEFDLKYFLQLFAPQGLKHHKLV